MMKGKIFLISLLIFLLSSKSTAYSQADGIQDGDQVKLDYIGKTSDGTIFDSTTDTGPVTLTISDAQLIEGFYQGMLGLFIGDSKTITVPPSLGYTDPNNDLFGETLIFDVHIIDVLNYDPSTDTVDTKNRDSPNNNTDPELNLPLPLISSTILPLLSVSVIALIARKQDVHK